LRQAVDIRKKLVADFPGVDPQQGDLARSLHKLGLQLRAAGETQEAADIFRQARDAFEKAAADSTHDPERQASLAWFLSTCPALQFRDPDRAVKLARSAVPQTASSGTIWNTLGVAEYRMGNWRAAIASLKKSRELPEGDASIDKLFLAMAHW